MCVGGMGGGGGGNATCLETTCGNMKLVWYKPRVRQGMVSLSFRKPTKTHSRD